MNKISWRVIATLSLAGLSCAKPSVGADVPTGTFSFGDLTIGITTLAAVQQTYGKAEASRVSREDGSDVTICYAHPSPDGPSFLVFESGVMGGFSQITGFRISVINPDGNCVPTDVDVGALETGNKIRLGQSQSEFLQVLPVEFTRSGTSLRYESVSQRKATAEELKALRTKWPNEGQDYFDVTITVQASFTNDQLADFHVRKIESY